MINSFKADWRKLRQRPAVWILGGIMLTALLLFGYVIPWLQVAFPSANFRPDPGTTLQQMKAALYPINFLKNSLTGVGIIGGILTLILGALVAGGEFNWGTIKTVYTQGPGRLQTLAGQVGVVSVIAAIFTVAFYLVAAAASLIIALSDGSTITWPAAIDVFKALVQHAFVYITESGNLRVWNACEAADVIVAAASHSADGHPHSVVRAQDSRVARSS